MTSIEDKVRHLISTANNGAPMGLISDADTEALLPSVMEKIQADAAAVGYDGYKGNAEDYPPLIWPLVYETSIRQIILDWIDAFHPEAWFRLMYESPEVIKQTMNQQKS